MSNTQTAKQIKSDIMATIRARVGNQMGLGGSHWKVLREAHAQYRLGARA
jgi:hypothetical protein